MIFSISPRCGSENVCAEADVTPASAIAAASGSAKRFIEMDPLAGPIVKLVL